MQSRFEDGPGFAGVVVWSSHMLSHSQEHMCVSSAQCSQGLKLKYTRTTAKLLFYPENDMDKTEVFFVHAPSPTPHLVT